ncbi:hypothetical protein EVJ58_g4804 [Rhodofomes roseus]|uniref:DUF3752 domain-containing protein n=1 Tax=Rhodofomes roseus TaxID=34475 RepID=A0A4Y9YHP7_9APHY|nr:hypothetical protein EVJ58_g4804 [Rhodofomes roseus]
MIGPDIPSHLPASSSARSTTSERDSEDSESHGPSAIGPAIPTHLLAGPSARSDGETEEYGPVSVGPMIPPGAAFRSQPLKPQHPPQDESEEEDDYVPALPPDMLASRGAGPTSGAKTTENKRVVGPALPPHLAGRKTFYDEDEDDDDYGPAPLPSGFASKEKSGVEEFLEREERRKKQLEEASKPKALQREEWMLVPPSQSDLLGSIDPIRVKRPRKFAATAQTPRDADASLWTETPAERQQRIADEVAGKRRRATDASGSNLDPEEERELRKKRRYEEEVRRGVEEHTRKVRGGTLLDQHARTTVSKDKDEEEGPPVIWDHSRDMALSGRLMDDRSRDKFVKEARGLGDRFGSGKSGGFL